MDITYRIEDGYCGHRTKMVRVPDDELCDLETVEEQMSYIEDAVQEAFAQEVSWSIDDARIRAELPLIRIVEE
jgi:hypothetical protein